MNAVLEPTEQTAAEMREDIDCTRSDLADKVEALQDRVMGTVQNAQDAVDDSIQFATDTVATVKRTFDIKHHVEQHPWAVVGGCFLAGLALGTQLQRMRRGPGQTPDQPVGKEPAASASQALPAEEHGSVSIAAAAQLPPRQSPPPSRHGLSDLFHDEIAKVKGLAIGYVIGLATVAIKDAMPHWAAQIEGLMDSVATKLGGQSAQRHST